MSKLYDERLARIQAAINLEPVDKVPLISGLAAAAAPFTGTSMTDFLGDMEFNCTVNIKATDLMGDVDGTQTPLSSPEALPSIWLSQIRVPGRELPDNELWQVLEKELVTQDDYDLILKDGFGPWYSQFMKEKLGDPISKMKPLIEYGPTAVKRFQEADYVVVKDGTLMTPFEMLCGGRSMEAFLVDDLLEIPETIDAVFEEIHKFNLDRYSKRFASPNKPFGVWVGGWRGTPETLNPQMFDRFSWKYFRDMVDLCLQYDVVPILHLDACWDKGLEKFKDIPAKKAIMALDGKTDIHLAKEIVGDRMCIMGDVPAQLLAFGKPEEVHGYVTNLINTIGPEGFMCCSGCDIPFNAKLENVQMMSKAIADAVK